MQQVDIIRLNKAETKAFQILVAVLATICFVPGGAGAFRSVNASSSFARGELIIIAESFLNGFIDNQYRFVFVFVFVFGVFFVQGLILLFMSF